MEGRTGPAGPCSGCVHVGELPAQAVLGPMGAVQHNAALEMESAVKSRYSCIAINGNFKKEALYLEFLWVSELTLNYQSFPAVDGGERLGACK